MCDRNSINERRPILTLCTYYKIIKFSGDTVVIFWGDFRQTLPVIPHGSSAEIVRSTLKKSFEWPFIKQLTENMRAKKNNSGTEFSKFLILVWEVNFLRKDYNIDDVERVIGKKNGILKTNLISMV